jgi:hypothetical protein
MAALARPTVTGAISVVQPAVILNTPLSLLLYSRSGQAKFDSELASKARRGPNSTRYAIC